MDYLSALTSQQDWR